MIDDATRAALVAAYGWEPHVAIDPLTGGLINATFAVREPPATTPIAVVQRLHPIFGAAVNDDLDRVTAHVAARGLTTPRLVRTLDGAAAIERDGRVWRALTWVEGETFHKVPPGPAGLALAEAGGALVGAFHRAVADLDHAYAFVRAGVHDTAAHLDALATHARGDGEAAWAALARDILAAADGLPPLPHVPRRHGHGDLKLSNLLFARDGAPRSVRGGEPPSEARALEYPPRGLALVDLDTLGLHPLTFELGDAMRSWCNPRGEDTGTVDFDLAIFDAAMRGYRGVAGAIVTPDELRAVVAGLEIVCVELAARFCVDVYRDSYFGWDAARFSSRREHNLVRARGQLALAHAVRAARADALALAQGE